LYFVDKGVLVSRLDYVDHLSHKLNDAEGFELERIAHMLIEATVDVGNMIIDAFILRDPGSYMDVIDILENEKAISAEDKAHFSATFEWRKVLTRDYTNIDHVEMKKDFLEHISAYQNFKDSVFSFFDNEGQAITAFKGDRNEL
jgi:uncharacterized protein YutE (UPF0331/DUF86 family)